MGVSRATGWPSPSWPSWSARPSTAPTPRHGSSSSCPAAAWAASRWRCRRVAVPLDRADRPSAGRGRGPAARRRHRAAPARGGAPRLRRQRLARAQDAGRRADPAGRGGASRPPTTPRRCSGSPARMQHEGARLGRLVRELIELSRLQGAEPLPGRRAGAGRPTSSTRRPTAPGWPPSGPASPCGVSCPDDLIVRGNESQLAMAVANLIDNAVAYSPRGTRVAVSAGRRRRPDRPASRSRSATRASASPRRPGAGLRAVLPGRSGPVARHRRHRPGAGDRQARRDQPRRLGVGVERPKGPARHSPSGYLAFIRLRDRSEPELDRRLDEHVKGTA